MVRLNPTSGNLVKPQNESLIKSLGSSKDQYSEDTINQALTALQDPNFMSEGLFKLLLMAIQNGLNITELTKNIGKIDMGAVNDAINGALGPYQESLNEISNKNDTSIDGLKNSVNIISSKFEKTTNHIYSQLQSNEFNGSLATLIKTLELTIKDIKKRYTEDLTFIQNALADSQLNYEEKLKLSYILSILREEHPSIKEQLDQYEVDSFNFVKTYKQLIDMTSSLYLDQNVNTVVDSNLFLTRFQSYYEELIDCLESLLDTIIAKSNKIINEAVSRVDKLTNIDSLIIGVSLLKVELSTELDNICSDGKMDPSEKQIFKIRYYDPIFSSFLDRDNELATYYEKSIQEIQDASTALRNTVDRLNIFGSRLNVETELKDNTELKTAFLDFYDAELNLYNELQKIATANLDVIKADIRQHTTTITQTNKEIDLRAKEISSIGEMLQSTQASIKVTANSITQTVEQITTIKDLASSNEVINGAGLNLFVLLNSEAGFIEPTTKALLPTVNGSRISEKIKVIGGLEYTASLWNNSIENTIWIYWMTEEGKIIKVDSKVGIDEEFFLTATAPDKAVFAQLVTYQTKSSNLQFQLGNIATAYRMSSYDSINNVILAQTELEDKEHDLDNNTRNYNDYSSENYQSNVKLERILADNKINDVEKDAILIISASINRQYKYITSKLSSYKETDVLKKLDSYVLALTDFTKQVTTTQGDYIVGSVDNVKTDYKLFFDESKRLLEVLNDLFIKDIEKAKERVSASTSSALDAETLRNDIKRELENTAHTISTLKKFKVNEDEYSTNILAEIIPYFSDGVLSAIEKSTINDVISRIKVEDNWYQETADKMSVGKAAFLTAKNNLLDLVNPMLTVNELYDSSKVDEVLLTKRFKGYFQEKAKLLDKIINSHLANYTLLQTQYSAAYNQFTLKNEELLAYQKAVNDAKNKITDLNDKIEELRNKVVYKIRLTSSMGDIFTNGQIKTRLSVELLKNDVDYTDNLRDQDIIWIKMNEDGQPDEEWNSAHVGAGKYIDITEEDVTNKAIFEVRVYELIE